MRNAGADMIAGGNIDGQPIYNHQKGPFLRKHGSQGTGKMDIHEQYIVRRARLWNRKPAGLEDYKVIATKGLKLGGST
jgi:hypothetical protein